MDPTYPYTIMDNSHMEDNNEVPPQHRQQPPPYSSCKSPAVSGYGATTPGLAPAPGPAPPAPIPTMPTVITVNNMGGDPASYLPSNVAVGRDPVIMTCPHCRCRNKTRTTGRATLKTHLACLLLACTGLCCLPYCLLGCRNVDHFCTTCDAYLGTYAN